MKESRHEGQRRRLLWLKRRNMFFMYRSAAAQNIEAEFLASLARRMKQEGQYSTTTYVGDIVHGLRKTLRNG